MSRFARWFGPTVSFDRKPAAPRLFVEILEARSTPAVIVNPGTPAGSAPDGDASEELLAISGDGKVTLFASKASNLVAGVTDNNGDFDLFWRDGPAGVTKLVTTQAGTLNAIGFGEGFSTIPISARAVLSYDGQRVAYVSGAQAAAVTGDAAVLDQLATTDVFWWRADTGAARLVSVRSGQNAAVGNSAALEAVDPNISDDGGTVAYGSLLDGAQIDASAALDSLNATYDLFVRDMDAVDASKATTAATRVPGTADLIGNYGAVDRPVGRYLSSDGRFVAFATAVGANLIAGVLDQTNTNDVFIRDMSVTTTAGATLVSIARNGAAVGNVADQFAQAPVISRDGSTVVFVAKAPGGADEKQLVADYVPNGAPTELYARTNLFTQAAVTRLVTATSGSANVGANGFLEPTTAGAPASYQVSEDGRYIAFVSSATNLVNASLDQNGIGLDVFLRDLDIGLTETISVGKDGKTGSTPSDRPSLSDDGRYVAFVSTAPELVSIVSDTNNVPDAFLRDRTATTTQAVSTTASGLATGDGPTSLVRVAADGTAVVFVSRARNLSDGAPLPGSTANVFQSPVPLPSLVAGGAVAVAGPADGQVKAFAIGTGGKLSAIGGGSIAFPGKATQTRVAVGDVNGDGSDDVISVVGPGGGSLVRVTDGATGADLVAPSATFEPSFVGGLFAAAADFDGDGKAEIVLSPDVGGGARIQVYSFNGSVLVQRANFFGIDDAAFRGGARVAAGDIDGDGKPEVIVGAGFGGGPRVAIYDGSKLFSVPPGANPPKLFGDFFAFPGPDSTGLRNGVFVAAGDISGDGKADLVFGGGPGGGPRVYVLDAAVLTTDGLNVAYGKPVVNFFAFESTLRGGVRVGVKDIDGDAKMDLIVGSGEKSVGQVRTYLGQFLTPAANPAAFEVIEPFGSGVLPGGVFVG